MYTFLFFKEHGMYIYCHSSIFRGEARPYKCCETFHWPSTLRFVFPFCSYGGAGVNCRKIPLFFNRKKNVFHFFQKQQKNITVFP